MTPMPMPTTPGPTARARRTRPRSAPLMRIDAHHHLWDPTRREQPWMDGPWADPIRRGYALSDLTPHLAAHGLDGTILVQSSSSYEETAELLTLAAGEGPVAGVVGWADLRDPALAEVLAALPAGLVGIRHQVQDEPDPDWLLGPDVLRGLAIVADAGLVYDLLVTPRELPAAHAAVRAVPQLAFVLDHAAKPAVATGSGSPGPTPSPRSPGRRTSAANCPGWSPRPTGTPGGRSRSCPMPGTSWRPSVRAG